MSKPRVPPATAATRAGTAGPCPPPPPPPEVVEAEGVAEPEVEGARWRGKRVPPWLMALGGPCTMAASSASAA